MTVQTVPPIEELTQEQVADLLDELAAQQLRFQTPDWHREILAKRREAAASGDLEYSDWESVKADLRKQIK